jgi:hypothetical protein
MAIYLLLEGLVPFDVGTGNTCEMMERASRDHKSGPPRRDAASPASIMLRRAPGERS